MVLKDILHGIEGDVVTEKYLQPAAKV